MPRAAAASAAGEQHEAGEEREDDRAQDPSSAMLHFPPSNSSIVFGQSFGGMVAMQALHVADFVEANREITLPLSIVWILCC